MIVLLHALAAPPAMWAAQRTALGAAGHRVLTPALGGHGDRPHPDGPPSMDLLVDELVAELDRADAGPVWLAGCSLGGYVALALLRRAPERVRGLALLATRAEPDEPADRDRRLGFAAAMADPAARATVVPAAAAALVGATTRNRRPELAAAVRTAAEAVDPAAVAWCQRAAASRADGTAELARFSGPGLALVGEEDELVSRAEVERVAAALPAGRLVVLPGVGHLSPLEAPDAVTAALTGWLARIPVVAP
ncbi:MAG TPA: alpha/beta hydrolase [Mycobacteriales bacterium]|nr:alpha/beta hydrolase [Mycobacteriales bacterium]